MMTMLVAPFGLVPVALSPAIGSDSQRPFAIVIVGGLTAALVMSVSVPLRIFDRNQGEKRRTQLDIGSNQQLEDAAQAQVFSDVDSAYAQLNSNVILLRPYKAKYLDQAQRVRETVTFAWQHGAASLMDFLNAQSDYRQVQLAYVQFVGSCLTAAGQLNLAVGQEVIQ
jgi:cobalt-zinc-cadmium efflux system outer membrane protein